MPEFDRLLLFHALRPDRLTAAMSKFVAATLGKEYVTSQSYNLERSFQVGIGASCLLCPPASLPVGLSVCLPVECLCYRFFSAA